MLGHCHAGCRASLGILKMGYVPVYFAAPNSPIRWSMSRIPKKILPTVWNCRMFVSQIQSAQLRVDLLQIDITTFLHPILFIFQVKDHMKQPYNNSARLSADTFDVLRKELPEDLLDTYVLSFFFHRKLIKSETRTIFQIFVTIAILSALLRRVPRLY